MSDRDLAVVDDAGSGDLSSYEPGPLTETIADQRDDIRQIIDDLMAEKAVDLPKGTQVKARRAQGDTSAFDRRTGAPRGFSDKSHEVWRRLPLEVRKDVAALSKSHDDLKQFWGSVRGFAEIAAKNGRHLAEAISLGDCASTAQ
jgi:hypothetical protein